MSFIPVSGTFRIQFPTLYGMSKTNKIQQWTIYIEPAEPKQKPTKYSPYILQFEYGYYGSEHMIQTKPTLFLKGKNIGRKNETTPKEQALRVAQKKWDDKCEKHGYATQLPSIQLNQDIQNNISKTPLLPMLASKADEKKLSHLTYPVFIQPKLDGVRCISDGLSLISRTGKQYTGMEHMVVELNELSKAFPGWIFDGELGCFPEPSASSQTLYNYKPGHAKDDKSDKYGEKQTHQYHWIQPELSFQQVCGYVKRKSKHITDDEIGYIRFIMFDIIPKSTLENENTTFIKRLTILNDIRQYIKKHNLHWVKVIETTTANHETDIYSFHQINKKCGFEGTIIRVPMSTYEKNTRSSQLLKYKDMITEEFKIVGFEEGKGNDTGTVIWIVHTNSMDDTSIEHTFKVRPKGTIQERRDLLEKARQSGENIGKLLTVQFQEYTDKGIPRFPVGLCIRDYE
jgi:ATP-dependent DNA ligase